MKYDAQGRPIPETPAPADESAIRTAIEAGKQIAGLSGKPQAIEGGVPYAVVPEGFQVRRLDDLLIKAPLRLQANPVFVDSAAFVAYVTRFATENTLLFADPDKNKVVAVIDYHQPDGQPSWCDHVATLQLETSPEWDDWSGIDRKDLDQEAFANFLEDHIGQVSEPDGKTLLDAILKIRLVRTQSTKAVRNLSTGEVQLAYTDEDTGGENTSKVPTRLKLILRYFRGQDPFKIDARLRYRPRGSSVVFAYLIDDLDKLQEKSFAEVVGAIGGQTGRPVYLGTP